jgi:hypothetical protein
MRIPRFIVAVEFVLNCLLHEHRKVKERERSWPEAIWDFFLSCSLLFSSDFFVINEYIYDILFLFFGFVILCGGG